MAMDFKLTFFQGFFNLQLENTLYLHIVHNTYIKNFQNCTKGHSIRIVRNMLKRTCDPSPSQVGFLEKTWYILHFRRKNSTR